VLKKQSTKKPKFSRLGTKVRALFLAFALVLSAFAKTGRESKRANQLIKSLIPFLLFGNREIKAFCCLLTDSAGCREKIFRRGCAKSENQTHLATKAIQ